MRCRSGFGLPDCPHLASKGDGPVFVIWRDTIGPDPNVDIYGARVTDAGVVLDPSGVAVANANPVLTPPAAGAPNAVTGTWEVAYTRFVADPPYGSFRVFHRSVNLN